MDGVYRMGNLGIEPEEFSGTSEVDFDGVCDLKVHDSKSTMSRLLVGVCGTVFLLGLSLIIGLLHHGWAATVSIISSSMLLEVLVGAAGSIPLGFDRVSGALVAGLANLVPAPLLILMFDAIIAKSPWLKRKLAKSEKWSAKYGRYGIWVLAPLSPFLGVYLCIAIGIGMRFRPLWMFASLAVGVLTSAFVVTFSGGWLKHFF